VILALFLSTLSRYGIFDLYLYDLIAREWRERIGFGGIQLLYDFLMII
jgi:hypothetical protein